jgi:hypothetical protein
MVVYVSFVFPKGDAPWTIMAPRSLCPHFPMPHLPWSWRFHSQREDFSRPHEACCYGLGNIPPSPPLAKFHVLRAWSSGGGAILRDSRNHRRWGLGGGSPSVGVCPILVPILCFLSAMRWRTSHHHDVSAQVHGTKQPWTGPTETMSQSFFPLNCSFGYFGHSSQK